MVIVLKGRLVEKLRTMIGMNNMKIIADVQTGGIQTACLAISWGLPNVCQVHGCEEKTYAILNYRKDETEVKRPLNIVICKKHYEEGMDKGSVKWKFDL